jgi:SAM-dependent methyltransferase
MTSTHVPDDRVPSPDPTILAFYEQGREDGRLREGVGRLELWRTQDILRRVLPKPGGLLLDVGGGSGAHARWLAADGWQVELIDLVPSHVEMAAAIPGVTARLGDARALSACDATADVVLLLGPLYHLPDPDDRRKALAEAARVVRPGGLIVAATINRHAPLHDQLNRGGWFEAERRARLEEIAEEGRNPGGGDFTTAYFHHPARIAAELAGAGLAVTGQYGVEGAAWLMGDIAGHLDDEERRTAVLAALRLTESDPALLGVSGHLLTAARRPLGSR